MGSGVVEESWFGGVCVLCVGVVVWRGVLVCGGSVGVD